MRTRRHVQARSAAALERPMLALRAPVEQILGHALRRVARRQPGVFERLGPFQSATFLIAPTGWPVAFALSPRRLNGEVRVVPRNAPGPFAARIEGALVDLLGLFDGSVDADSAFFARSVQVEGDTGAVVALHNALEAAELSMADLLGLPIGGTFFDRGVRVLRTAAETPRRRETAR